MGHSSVVWGPGQSAERGARPHPQGSTGQSPGAPPPGSWPGSCHATEHDPHRRLTTQVGAAGGWAGRGRIRGEGQKRRPAPCSGGVPAVLRRGAWMRAQTGCVHAVLRRAASMCRSSAGGPVGDRPQYGAPSLTCAFGVHSPAPHIRAFTLRTRCQWSHLRWRQLTGIVVGTRKGGDLVTTLGEDQDPGSAWLAELNLLDSWDRPDRGELLQLVDSLVTREEEIADEFGGAGPEVPAPSWISDEQPDFTPRPGLAAETLAAMAPDGDLVRSSSTSTSPRSTSTTSWRWRPPGSVSP